MLYRFIKANPDSLTPANLGKSFYSMGLLAIALIVFIAVVVMLLRQSA
jgi:hypothetical protein